MFVSAVITTTYQYQHHYIYNTLFHYLNEGCTTDNTRFMDVHLHVKMQIIICSHFSDFIYETQSNLTVAFPFGGHSLRFMINSCSTDLFSCIHIMLLLLFLNLPIWANFVDPTDLSLYLLLLLLPTLDQTSSIGWTQPHPQPQPGLAKQHWLRLRLRLRPSLLDWAG